MNCLRNVGTRGSEPATSAIAQSTQTGSQYNSGRRGGRTGGGASRKLQPLTVFCTPKGLTFHVYGSSKQSQASIDLPASFFSMFDVQQQHQQNSDDEPVDEESTVAPAGGEFCVNLTTLLECLSVVAGTSAKGVGANGAAINDQRHHRLSSALPVSMTMTYHLSTELLKIELEEPAGGMLCTAAIPGMMLPDDNDDTGGMAGAFLASPTQAQILLPSIQLSAILPELEYVAGATVAHLGIRTNPAEQQQRNRTRGRRDNRGGGLELGTIGHAGQCWMSLQHGKPASVRSNGGRRKKSSRRKGPFALENGDDDDCIVRYAYPLHRFLQSMKALDIANETCLSINQQGMMAIQHQIYLQDSPPDTPAFCDFVLVALEEDSDDEESETEATFDEEDGTTVGDGDTMTSSTSSSRHNGSSTKSHHSQLSSSQGSSLPPRSRSSRKPQRRRKPRKDEANEAMEGTSTNNQEDSSSSTDDGGDRNDDKHGDDEEEDETTTPSLVAPLFGTVVNGQASMSTSTPSQQAEERRRQRRIRRRLSRGSIGTASMASPTSLTPSRSTTHISDASPSAESVDLLADDKDDNGGGHHPSTGTTSRVGRGATRQLSMSQDESSRDDRRKQSQMSQSQDTLNERSHYRHPDDYKHDDECPSSPELVYGQQY